LARGPHIGVSPPNPDAKFKRPPKYHPLTEKAPILAEITLPIMRPYERTIMNKLKIAKTTARYMVGYGTATAATIFFRQHRNHSDIVPVELAIDASTWLSAYAVSGVVAEPAKQYVENQIDEIAKVIQEFKK
jgi:hypothetical protein